MKIYPTIKDIQIETKLLQHKLTADFADVPFTSFDATCWTFNLGRPQTSAKQLFERYKRRALKTSAPAPVVCLFKTQHRFIDGQTTASAHRALGASSINCYIISQNMTESRIDQLRATWNIDTSNDLTHKQIITQTLRAAFSGVEFQGRWKPTELADALGIPRKEFDRLYIDENDRQNIAILMGTETAPINNAGFRASLRKHGVSPDIMQKGSKVFETFFRVLNDCEFSNGDSEPLIEMLMDKVDSDSSEKKLNQNLAKVMADERTVLALDNPRNKEPAVFKTVKQIKGAHTCIMALKTSGTKCPKSIHSRMQGMLHQMESTWRKLCE